MNKKQLALWYKTITVILIGFGLLYFLWGLKIFAYTVPLIPKDVILDWVSALYGAIMLGWGVTLFMLGRIAFTRDDAELKKVLIVGLTVWLAFEAAASAWLGVWFNVGVDFAVGLLFAVPLLNNRKR